MPLCLPPLFRSASRSDRSEDLTEGGNRHLRRRAAASILFAAAFAAVDAASQVVGRVQRATGLLQEGSFNPVRLLMALVLSGAACWGLLALVDLAARRRGRDSQEAGAQPGAGWRDRRRLALLAFLIPLICWSLLYAHLWPMASMNDTAWILRDPIGAGAQHPITYGLSIGVLFRLGRLVGGDLTGVVLLSAGQMLLWATCVSGLVVFLDRKGASRGVTGSLIAYCALMPLVADYSFAVVKDSAFSLFATLLIPVLLVVRASAGQVLLSRRGIAVVVTAPAGFALMRSNALPVVLIALALVVWWSRAHLRRALAVTALALVIIVVPSAMTAQSQHAKEALGIPLQMIGYTLVHDADCLPSASRQVFDNVLAPETWRQVYRPSSVDPVKDSPAFNGAYLDAHRGQFLSAWGRALVACPRPFVTGFLIHTANLWRFDADPIGTEGQSRFVSVVSNHPADREQVIRNYARAGVVNHSLLPQPLQPVAGTAVRVMEATPGPGTWMWVVALSVVGFVYAGWREWVAIYAPVILLWATLMVAAPTVTPFRYTAPLIMVAPIGLGWLTFAPSRRQWFSTPRSERTTPRPPQSQAVMRHRETVPSGVRSISSRYWWGSRSRA